jgi:hypothetical protein
MIFQFEIDNTNLQRLSDALDNPISGFVFVQGEGTLVNQKKKFLRDQVKGLFKTLCFNSERENAIVLEPNDTAALQAQRFVGLDDVTGSIN